MIWFRSFSAVLLALLMAVTSVTMAVARGQDRMGDAVEICASFGTSIVMLDANGQPLKSRHPCPDCLTGVTALDLQGLPFGPKPPQSAGRAIFSATAITAPSLPTPQATARGPPSLI